MQLTMNELYVAVSDFALSGFWRSELPDDDNDRYRQVIINKNNYRVHAQISIKRSSAVPMIVVNKVVQYTHMGVIECGVLGDDESPVVVFYPHITLAHMALSSLTSTASSRIDGNISIADLVSNSFSKESLQSAFFRRLIDGAKHTGPWQPVMIDAVDSGYLLFECNEEQGYSCFIPAQMNSTTPKYIVCDMTGRFVTRSTNRDLINRLDRKVMQSMSMFQ